MKTFGEIPFPLVLGGLAAATLGGVYALLRAGFGAYSLGFLGVTMLVGGIYLVSYSKRPLRAPRAPSTSAAPPAAEDEEEPFDDPVLEADRLGNPSSAEPTEESTRSPPPESGGPETTDDGLESD